MSFILLENYAISTLNDGRRILIRYIALLIRIKLIDEPARP